MTIRAEIEALRSMTVGRLRERYAEVFGEPSRSYNKQFLFRRVAWRIQALAEGGLSERARQRALEIANDADLRVRPPKDAIAYGGPPAAERATVIRVRHAADGRLPMPGSLLVRDYRGKQILVKVLENGFQYDDRQYTSLTAIAQEVNLAGTEPVLAETGEQMAAVAAARGVPGEQVDNPKLRDARRIQHHGPAPFYLVPRHGVLCRGKT